MPVLQRETSEELHRTECAGVHPEEKTTFPLFLSYGAPEFLRRVECSDLESCLEDDASGFVMVRYMTRSPWVS